MQRITHSNSSWWWEGQLQIDRSNHVRSPGFRVWDGVDAGFKYIEGFSEPTRRAKGQSGRYIQTAGPKKGGNLSIPVYISRPVPCRTGLRKDRYIYRSGKRQVADGSQSDRTTKVSI